MKREHELFALEIAKGATNIEAYKKAYPKVKDDNGAGAAATRLLKRPDIKNEIVKLKNTIVKQAEQAAVDEIKKEKKFTFLDFATKRELLYKIANGKIKIQYTDSQGKKRYKEPDAADRINAIKLDIELTGEGFRPPDPDPGKGGNTYNGPVYNTVVRNIKFGTRVTTSKGQTFEVPQSDQ